jgi:ABC-type phosphate transport system auxiliary subunit
MGKTKHTEQQLNMRNSIQQELYRMDSMRRQGEKVNMKEYFKLQKQLEALNKILE